MVVNESITINFDIYSSQDERNNFPNIISLTPNKFAPFMYVNFETLTVDNKRKFENIDYFHLLSNLCS